MAKKDKKKSKKKDNPGADAVGAVRTAVERTFQATADSAQSTRTRAQDLVDEVAGAAVRVREMIEQVGVLEDLKGLRGQVEELSRRVAQLESGATSKPATRSRSASTRSKPAAAKSSAAKSSSGGGRKPAASRSSSRSTASRSTAGSTRKTTRSSPAKKSS